MNRLIRISIIALCLFLVAVVAFAQENKADEASLLAAWEAQLSADPNTELFQKSAERSYRYKTKLFSFDGELRVLGLLIQDQADGELLSGIDIGTVEVELVGFGTEQMQRYAQSYAHWMQGNTLYFDRELGRWLAAREYRSRISSRIQRRYRSPWIWLSNYGFVIFLAVLVFFLWILSRKTGGQMKKAVRSQDEVMEISRRSIALSERSQQLAEDSNRVLKEILEELKKGRGGSDPQS